MDIKLTVTDNQLKLIARAVTHYNIVERENLGKLSMEDSDDLSLLDNTFTQMADKLDN